MLRVYMAVLIASAIRQIKFWHGVLRPINLFPLYLIDEIFIRTFWDILIVQV